jgi:hypothetical protein
MTEAGNDFCKASYSFEVFAYSFHISEENPEIFLFKEKY